METKRKFKVDIELLMILFFTLLVAFVSFSLLSPIIDFILTVFDFTAVSVILENAFLKRPENQKLSVIGFIFITFLSIFIIAKIKNKKDSL